MIGAGRISNEGQGRDKSTSQSPSAQLLQPTQSAPYDNSFRNNSIAATAEARTIGHPVTPLIDTLPRKKQKQIYQIIGGVQSGIRNVRQQTEGLQKQLDLLQAALEIDADDENDESLIQWSK
jgi:protoheme ferro-lyase